MKLVGYIRVSRVAGREGESFISPDVQKERIEAHARAHGHKIVDWYTDLDQSGGKLDRPKLEEAVQSVERGQAEGVAVAKLDRFARSVSGAAQMLERLEAANGVLVAVDLGMDTSTSGGKLMRNVLMALAEFELDRIAENWSAATEHAIRRGVHISRVPPTGYVRDPESKRFEPDPVAAPVVAEAFRMRGRGASWEELCTFMDKNLPRGNGGAWTRQTIGGLFENRVYLGEAYNGALVNLKAHEPLITRAEWEQAQRIAARPPVRVRKAQLAGVIYCDACGHLMTRHSDGKRGYFNYRCRVRHSDGVCPAPARISTRKAEAYVWNEITEFVRRGDIQEQRLQISESYESAVADVEKAERELAAWRDSGLLEEIGKEHFLAGFREREVVLDEARALLDSMAAPVMPELSPTLDIDAFSTDPSAPPWLQRRTLIEILIKRIVVTQGGGDERIRLEWRDTL